MLHGWHLQGRAVFLPNFHSILIHPTISLAQNPRAHQAEGINSPGSPIIALLPSNFITLFEIQVIIVFLAASRFNLRNPRILNLGIFLGCNDSVLLYLRGFNGRMIVFRMCHALWLCASRLVLQPCWFMINSHGHENISCFDSYE